MQAARFLFRVDAGAGVGLGHLKRCLSLGEAILELGGSPFFLCHADPICEDILHKSRFGFQLLSETINHGMDIEEINVVSKNIGASTIIVDSYNVDSDYFLALRDKGLQVVYLEDFGRLDWPIDVVINGIPEAEKLQYLAPVRLLGTEFLILNREYWSPLSRTIKGPPKTMLVTVGGVDRSDLTIRLIDIFQELALKIKIHIVLGPYFYNSDDIISKVETSGLNVDFHYFPRSLYPLMYDCDLAVSAGGRTIYELIAMRVPGIGIWLSENQRSGVEILGRYGATVAIGYSQRPEFDSSVSDALVRLIKDDSARAQIVQCGKRLVDGCGAGRIAKILLQKDEQRSIDRSGAQLDN